MSDEQVIKVERSACPTCGSLFRDVHGELRELPDRSAGPVAVGQRLSAGDHADRKELF